MAVIAGSALFLKSLKFFQVVAALSKNRSSAPLNVPVVAADICNLLVGWLRLAHRIRRSCRLVAGRCGRKELGAELRLQRVHIQRDLRLLLPGRRLELPIVGTIRGGCKKTPVGPLERCTVVI